MRVPHRNTVRVEAPPEAAPGAPVRVVVLDGLSIVPYYAGHLSASLDRTEGVRVRPASITYHHDPGFFSRLGIRNNRGLLDLAWRAPAALRRPLKVLEYLVNLAVLLASFAFEKPDALHVQFLPLLQWGLPVEYWYLRLVRACGIRVIYTVHNVMPQDRRYRGRRAYERVYALADRLICHDTEASARLVAEFSVTPDRITVIPHGPLFENMRRIPSGQARTRLGIEPDSCVFLWQGILRPYKGVSFLLKAWREVCATAASATLAIVGGGDPELAKSVEREAAGLGIRGRVRLELRFVSVEELGDWFAAADVLVYPYSEITTSGALMTGVVYGKAVVATSLAAFRQILTHEEDALLVPYGDVAGLADCLLRLAREPELRRRLGGRLLASQARLPRWAEIAGRTRDCYLETLRQRSGASLVPAAGKARGQQVPEVS